MLLLFFVLLSLYGYSADQIISQLLMEPSELGSVPNNSLTEVENHNTDTFSTSATTLLLQLTSQQPNTTLPTTPVIQSTAEAHPVHPIDTSIKCDWPSNEAMEVGNKVELLTEDCSELTGKVVIEGRIGVSTYNKLTLITRLNGSLTIGCSAKALRVLGQFSNLKTIENNVPGFPALTICYTKKNQQERNEIAEFRKRVQLICAAGRKKECIKEKGWIDGVNAFVRSLVLARRLPGRIKPSGELSDDFKILRDYLHGIFIFVSVFCLLLSTGSIFIIIYCLQLHKPRHERKSRGLLYRLKFRNNSEVAERELHPLTHYRKAEDSQKSHEDLLIHPPPPANSIHSIVQDLTARELSTSGKTDE